MSQENTQNNFAEEENYDSYFNKAIGNFKAGIII